jgi:hypothetical protein
MKHSRWLALAALICSTFSFAETKAPLGKVVELKGEAHRVLKGSGSEKLTVGSKVFPDDRIATGTDSMARLLIENNEAIQLGPNSEIVLEHPKKETMTVHLIAGNLLSHVRKAVEKLSAPRYEVRSGSAVMGVRGTTFFVQQKKGKPTFVCICNGTVALNWNGKENVFTSQHHDNARLLEDSKKALMPVPMGHDHNDGEAAALANILEPSASY